MARRVPVLRALLPWALVSWGAVAATGCHMPAPEPRPEPASAAPARTPLPPNIVLFLVDDLGWQDLSEPFWRERTEWNERYETPNVERLCRAGTKFVDAYAHPVCSPSRVSLLTGIAAARHRVTHWTLQPDTPTDPQRGGLRRPDWHTAGLSDDPATPHAICAETLPQRLRAAGYATILIGKAHLGAVGTPGADPANLGFDVSVGGHAAGAPSSHLARQAFLRRPADRLWQVPGLEFYHGSDRFLTDVLTDEALAAADRARSRDRPFFLYLSHYAVHTPLDPDDRFVGRYRERGLSEPEARYAALVAGVDHSLGRVLDWLDRHGLADETVVVFASDNGGLSANSRGGDRHHHNEPLRSGKGSAYEGGIRVPLVVRWPGQVPADRIARLPVQFEDLMPTLTEFAGAESDCPDGHSFAAACRGAPGEPHPLFWHHPHYWGSTGPGIEPFSAVRDGDLKLIWFYADQRAELYDLASDIGERHDLAAERPDAVARLRRTLREQLTRCAAQLPTDADGTPVGGP